MKMKKIRIAVLLVVAWFAVGAEACTSVLVSGRATADGRPLLLKNRDTDDLDNLNIIGRGSKYRYLAIVAASDLPGESTWSGHNEKGFAIINTAAYNAVDKCENDDKEYDLAKKINIDGPRNLAEAALAVMVTVPVPG